jgi:gluconolactonase
MSIRALVLVLLLWGDMSFAQSTQPTDDLISPDAKLQKLTGALKFTEGPVWMPDMPDFAPGFLIFSDIPSNELKRWDEKGGLITFRANSNGTNGNTRDREGRLISCEGSARRVVRTEHDGTIAVLVDSYQGKKFNSPNDVVVKSDGTIWFTDPPYGMPKGQQREIEKNCVLRIDPQTKQVAIVADDLDMPNGLCFSPDEKRLYIADSGRPHHVRVYNQQDGELKNGQDFCTIDKGVPDGMRCDERGNLWSSAGDGVQIFSPDGKLIQRIAVPEAPANLCFGGADGKTLFITARSSLYCIQTNVKGAGAP